ncbi:polypeptide N-acetylgalactosaminyltransferase 5-like [Mercenaria mercenaria]|uniref:polypeptide N-acetylgalactosaminyltransferase 5-like n=1 Tax=Mercenaria mercenaria TaxID=6596 RepID=UPI001E1E1BFB|nr:polypeptide N-acetylgalactosaminyltransferase 5-like [Mercenaria mercenaria]
MSAQETHKMQQLYILHGFNAYISDMIPFNRTLPDIRSENCKKINYDVNPETTDLPQTSVIIVFHNEALSVLMRTIFSVIRRTPDFLLKEIILVDDFSTLDEMKQPLALAISRIRKVRLLRTIKHEGLIRARLIGTRNATAPVLTFLDAHVECFKGWLEPLLERLVEKSDTVVCPQLQTISGKTFKIAIQDKVYVGTFQLSDLVFDWIPVQYNDQHLRSSDTDTARSPVFSGGMFSIYKSYFYKIGAYDKDMNLWGGENLELSFRVWMCGGSVEIHPCSNVAHLFRQTNPLEVTMKTEVDKASVRNNLRTASVWMDNFKKFYVEKGMEEIDVGNISERTELRRQLKCMSFQWYIDNVYPGLYVPGRALLLGEIRNPAYDVCIDSGINIISAHIGASRCSNKTTQFWHLSKLNALQREIGCIEYPENIKDDPRPTLERCDGGGPKQHWVYTKNGWLYNPETHLCLGLTNKKHTLQMLKCENNDRLHWKWHNTGIEDKFTGR